MSDQPEALRLADAIDYPDVSLGIEAAAELRRLHEENELNKALVREAQEMAIKLSGENRALLEALHWIADRCPAYLADHPPHGIHREMAHDAGACARAAIARCEGEKE